MKERKQFIDYIYQNRVISHFIFWIGLVSLFTLLAILNSGTFHSNIANSLALLPSQIAAAYILNYYQIPKLLLKRRYLLFGVSLLSSIYFFSALGRLSIIYLAEPFVREDFVQESIQEVLADSAYLFSVYFPTIYVYAFLMLLIKAVKSRFEEKHQIEILQKEKMHNELKFLKAQIQPHFLFNTLNNLYALTLVKSDLAPKVVLKLSEILDFILYQSQESRISIQKEIELLEAFIELETLRYGQNLKKSFKHNLTTGAIQIAPLMLLPLVENAFKHGTKGDTKATIKMNLVATKKHLSFTVKNSKPSNEKENYITASNSGIGLTNLKRQLALNYPKKHQLNISQTDDTYLVKLHIDFN